MTLTLLIFNSCDYSKVKTRQTSVLDTMTVYYNTTRELKNNQIPDSVFQMKKLRHLAIQGMECDYGDTKNCWAISEIPKQINNLKELETLTLNVNAIKTLPIEIRELHNLKSLDLTDNQGISDIENIVYLTNLEELALYGCNLEKLPVEIGKLKKLKHLGISGNNFEETEIERIKKALPNCEITF